LPRLQINHRKKSKDSHEAIDLTAQNALGEIVTGSNETSFVGYAQLAAQSQIMGIVVSSEQGSSNVTSASGGDTVQIILDQTPFYGESGGQIGDRGYLSGDDILITIEDVQKEANIFIHKGTVERGAVKVGDTINANIDLTCRRRVQANHTATHLLQAALKKVVDDSVSQAGSLVSFERLRFDFNSPRPCLGKNMLMMLE